MNNSIKDYDGQIVGFRCWTCNGIFQSMWGEKCNSCRNREKENKELLSEIRRLTNAIKLTVSQSE